ncbi:MAG: TerB N-terminal domain-containing protein [Clostridiales bacterium]|nr:TerB N-terminal domain-containing protein [Clostridiales bacterium]
MSEIKQYLAESIPSQKNKSGEYVLPLERIRSGHEGGLFNTSFAEIEYDSVAYSAGDGASTWRQPKFAPPQPIEQYSSDPIRQKFNKMRQLAEKDPFSRNNAKLFYKQAKFMEAFTDDYQSHEPLSLYYPYYQLMGHGQLRTYFTWRTKVRGGDIQPIDQSYVFLYLYELLSNIGVADPVDGLDKILTLWKAFDNTELAPILQRYIPGWLSDYHVYYQLPESFAAFVNKQNLLHHYPLMFLLESNAEKSLELWSDISRYDITKSKFYLSGHEELMRDCFFAVLGSIREFLAGKCISLKYLLFYSSGKKTCWQPFSSALFFNWYKQPNHQVEMPGGDKYNCKNNYWTWQTAILASGGISFAGYLIKKIESCLRQAIKFKYKLAVPQNALRTFEPKLKEAGLTIELLDSAIEQAVADFYAASTRTVVEVNQLSLSRIRQEAMGTQEKLLVAEENNIVPEIKTALGGNMPEHKPAKTDTAWENLKYALAALELEALFVVLEGQRDIKQFADNNHIMLEVLAEGINEKALDHIGDNILEVTESLAIYEDYLENVLDMVGL